MNLNLSSAVRTAKSVITANSPVLLVGTAVVGVVTTGILAAKGGYKARGIVDRARAEEALQEKGRELTNMDLARLTWKCYAVPSVTGASTIASVLGVHVIHNKRHAALAGLYAVTTSKLDDVREEAEALLGPKKTQELNNALAQKAVDANPLTDHEVIITPAGNELCHDEWGGRWFYADLPTIEKAVGEINLALAENGDANVNEFYDHLGMTPTQVGAQHGWSGQGSQNRVSVRIGTATASDGRSAISFRFHPEPPNLSRV